MLLNAEHLCQPIHLQSALKMASSNSLGACGLHDVGGLHSEDIEAPIDRDEKDYSLWERRIHVLLGILVRKGLMAMDEHRRAVEQLPNYEEISYYEKVRWPSELVQECAPGIS